jgi:hypothetical protein
MTRQHKRQAIRDAVDFLLHPHTEEAFGVPVDAVLRELTPAFRRALKRRGLALGDLPPRNRWPYVRLAAACPVAEMTEAAA